MQKLRKFVLTELSSGTDAKDLLPMVLLAKTMMGGGGGGGRRGQPGQGQGLERGGRITRNGRFVNPLPTKFGGSQFHVQDAEGAPGPGGRYHAAADWFAPGGTKVRAAITGKVVEVRASRGNSGQIFGGVVKIQGPNGRVFVYRHVDPRRIRVGQRVKAGDIVASVTNWASGSSHVHLEIWKTLAGGYNLSNMIDPATYFG
jgi:murein DD-endopeptidase MepM/ murein hydrolase activator NlpD